MRSLRRIDSNSLLCFMVIRLVQVFDEEAFDVLLEEVGDGGCGLGVELVKGGFVCFFEFGEECGFPAFFFV